MAGLPIREAATPAEFEVARSLIIDYSKELGIDLRFQNFDDEMARISETYDAILIAGDLASPDGCVGLKALDETRCEMKRLYVQPSARGRHVGEALAVAVIEKARAAGYREMVLDTLTRLGPAVKLYERLGFERCEPYYANPEPDVIYLRLAL